MRPAFYRQTCISDMVWLPLDRSQELKVVSDQLDRNPQIVELVSLDLQKAKKAVGAVGLSAEQVVRALIVMFLRNFSYRELAFHLADSRTFHTFCRLNPGQAPSKSALAAAIKAIRPETLEAMNRQVLRCAGELGVEDAGTVRTDCTVTKTLMHAPSDSALLVDGIRVLTLRVVRAQEFLAEAAPVINHLKRAKQCARAIATARKGDERLDMYRELLTMAHEAYRAGREALTRLEALAQKPKRVQKLIKHLKRYLPLIEKGLDQAKRRVLEGEKVPSQDKVLSLFEDHTDVIVKSWKEAHYGHKICLVTGRALILDSWVLDGNPADSTLTAMAIQRASENCSGRVPLQAVFDGGFRSRKQLEELKALGLKDVVFSKHQGIKIEEMVDDPAVFDQLRNFRAGIEGCISFLKRTFGLDRCTWRSLTSYRAYVASAVLACNLLLLARSQL